MRNVNILTSVTNDLGEKKVSNVIGKISNNNIITYCDLGVNVDVMIGDTIKIIRQHPDYTIELIFEENKKNSSIYRINNPRMDLNAEVNTIVIKRYNRGFYIEYILKLNNNDMGTFCVEYKWEE